MTTTKQDRISIDNAPSKVADSIAEHLFSTTHIKASGLRKRIPGEEGREAVAIRTCNFTFRSLTLVSKKGSQLWIKYLLRHVRLDIAILTGFVSLVERDPGLAGFIQSLTLVSCASFKPIVGERSGVEPATKFIHKVGIMKGDLSDLRPGQIIGTASNQRIWRSAKRLANRFPTSFDKRSHFFKIHLGFPEQKAFINGIIGTCIARILKHASNLQSLTVNGNEIYFPFCERIGTDARPFSSFTSSLTQLHIRKWEHIHPVITCKNIVWFLINLPNLQEASFYAILDFKDSKFIKEHHEAISQLTSKDGVLRELELDILDHLSNSQDRRSAEEDAPLAIQRLLFCCTRGLTKFSIRYEDFELGGNRLLAPSVLEGLQLSFTTLKSLKVEWMGERPPYKKNKIHLANFVVLETLYLDQFIVSALVPAILDSENASEVYQPLPSSLKEIQMTFNCREYAAGSAGQRDRSSPSEAHLIKLLETLSNHSVKKISTSASPIDHHGKLVTGSINVEWRETRNRLKRCCAEAGLELELVEEEF